MCLVPIREGLSVEVPPLLRLGPFGSSYDRPPDSTEQRYLDELLAAMRGPCEAEFSVFVGRRDARFDRPHTRQ